LEHLPIISTLQSGFSAVYIDIIYIYMYNIYIYNMCYIYNKYIYIYIYIYIIGCCWIMLNLISEALLS
jgi:hypothetical protein